MCDFFLPAGIGDVHMAAGPGDGSLPFFLPPGIGHIADYATLEVGRCINNPRTSAQQKMRTVMAFAAWYADALAGEVNRSTFEPLLPVPAMTLEDVATTLAMPAEEMGTRRPPWPANMHTDNNNNNTNNTNSTNGVAMASEHAHRHGILRIARLLAYASGN